MLWRTLNEERTREILVEKFDRFKTKLLAQATKDEVGAKYIAEQIDRQLNDFCKQLSLFED